MSKIFVSIPVLGKPCLQMIYNLYQAILSCREHQVRVYWNSNDSLIQRVRNCHISDFLFKYTECDYFMSLDSDIEVLNCYPNNNIFNKLIANDVEFAGGLYALKKQEVRRCSSIGVDGITPQFDTGLQEMRWLSSGCWCLKRSMVEKMYEKYRDELVYDGDDNFAGKKIIGLYNCIMYDLKPNDFPDVKLPYRKLLSEDWSFCQRWSDMGGKIYADTSIALRHIGEYSYSLYDLEVKKVPAPMPPQPGFDLGEKK